MVTTIKEKILDFADDFYIIFMMVLLFPIFLFLWIISLIKGYDLNGEEEWR